MRWLIILNDNEHQKADSKIYICKISKCFMYQDVGKVINERLCAMVSQCPWICLIIRNMNIYGIGVGI